MEKTCIFRIKTNLMLKVFWSALFWGGGKDMLLHFLILIFWASVIHQGLSLVLGKQHWSRPGSCSPISMWWGRQRQTSEQAGTFR